MTEPQYKVGKLYNPDRKVWTQGADFNYRRTEDGKGMLELRLFYENLSRAEIQAVRNSSCKFGFSYLYYGVIVFMYIFGADVVFGDCTFSSHLVPEEDRAELPEVGSENYGKLFIILTEAKTGIVKALRFIQLSQHFSEYFYDTIGAERDIVFSKEKYDEYIKRIYARYHDTFSLFRTANLICLVEDKSMLM